MRFLDAERTNEGRESQLIGVDRQNDRGLLFL